MKKHQAKISSQHTALSVIRRNSAADKEAISTATALKAAEMVVKVADKANINWALAGGLAMHFYGFTRATKDVDLVASDLLKLPAVMKLSFGGETYEVKVKNKVIKIGWIIRDDFFREFYENALRDSIEDEKGWHYITPEWMVILKYIAGRGKDQIDLMWLLQQTDLVDRDLIRKLMIEVLGEKGAALPVREIERLFAQADLNKMRDEE